MGRSKGKYLNPEKPTIIQCPLDLDSLVMSSDCSPQLVEENLDVDSNTMVWDAVKNSTCASWLLQLDVFSSFSKGFRTKMFDNLLAFPLMSRVYFELKLDSSPLLSWLKAELDMWRKKEGIGEPSQLFNPLNMLSNDVKDFDLLVLHGKSTLREMLICVAQRFLESGNRNDADLSHSLFLPEFLSPWFFKDLTEAEQLVILGNMDRYFIWMTQFRPYGMSIRRVVESHHELHPPQALLKHILSGEVPYQHRVKMFAWRQLIHELSRRYERWTNGLGTRMFSQERMVEIGKPKLDAIKAKGYEPAELDNWLNDADGIFEALELECTLHGVDATDLLGGILYEKAYLPMAEGLMNFQDEETRERLFKEVSYVMESHI